MSAFRQEKKNLVVGDSAELLANFSLGCRDIYLRYVAFESARREFFFGGFPKDSKQAKYYIRTRDQFDEWLGTRGATEREMLLEKWEMGFDDYREALAQGM